MNSKTSRAVFVYLCLCFFTLAPIGTAREKKDNGAPTPEEVVKRVQKSLKADKLAEALPYIAEPEHDIWVKQEAAKPELIKAIEAYADALDEKFGKDPAYRQTFSSSMKEIDLGPIEVHEVKQTGKDKVQLVLWKKIDNGPDGPGKISLLEKKVDAIKTEAGWKLHLSPHFLLGGGVAHRRDERKGPDGKILTVWVEDMENEATTKTKAKQSLDLIGRIAVEAPKQTQAVRAGKYKTRQEALEAFEKSVKSQEK